MSTLPSRPATAQVDPSRPERRTSAFPRPTAALLLAVSGLATLPTHALGPRITIQRDGQGYVVAWPMDHLLQSAPSALGPWTAVPNASRPHRVPAPLQPEFYRSVAGVPLSVTRAGTGVGSVASTTAGIACGDDCAETYPPGTRVTLRATPAQGSAFAGWSGDCTGTGDCVLAMDQPRSVTATFTPAAPVNPFVNGDFEQGPLVGWAQEPAQLIFDATNLGGAQPFSGRYAAWVGFDRDGRRAARLGQRVTLPATTPLYLNFAAYLYSEEICDVPWYDAVTIYVNGQTVFQDDRVCRTDTGWAKYSLEVSAYAGQSAAFVFEIYSADALSSVVLLDEVAISDQAWAP